MRITDIEFVYGINLDRRKDRWIELEERWAKTEMPQPLLRFSACDGQQFTPPRSWDVGRAAWGCYLSHVSLLTHIVRLEIEHALILEDDAYFVDDFKNKLRLVLNDLPPIYDQLYLGYQLLHTDRLPPYKITEHLGRGRNMNRNHATLYSRRGAARLLAHLLDLGERHKKEHIDHWLGRAIHEAVDKTGEHIYDCYIALPQLAYQGAGQSDICGKSTPLNKWLYSGEYLIEQPKVYYVLDFKTGYGDMGRNGELGYENKKVSLPEGAYISTLSLHAPSKASVTLSERLKVAGYMDVSGGPGEAVEVVIDGQVIGQIQAPGEMTKQIKLDKGEHLLEFRIPDEYKGLAHTIWVFSRV